MAFDPVDPKQSFPELEHGILRYWKEEDVFKRSIRLRSKAFGDPLNDPRGQSDDNFNFYDGPPFATGLPHYGHLLAGTIKDVIPRYQTMRGKRVERRFGWDCHGLPVENEIEKEHKLKGKPDIEKLGTKAFNDLCRSIVQRYTKEWKTTVERMGRFVDMDHDYRTMDPDYMESIWWVFQSLAKKGWIYEGSKPMHICPRCATPLSNFEVTQGYKDRTDQSVIVTFPLKDDPNTCLLAWTTTPWSLPGNMWLAVGSHIVYVKVKSEGKMYILAEKLVEKVFGKKEHEIVGAIDAKTLEELRYEPLFPYFVNTVIPSTKQTKKPQTYGERVFKVIMNKALEVSDADGTGIVHLTSSTGEDSDAAAKLEGVDVLPHVQMDGYFVPAVTDFQGVHVKPEGEDPQATDKAMIDHMKKRDRVFSQFTITHSYPHCWRCDTPLLPYTTGSWFVAVEKMKKKMLAANAQTHWVPDHLRDGRFGKWLEGARDWAISRNRYWGTPLPIWRNASGDMEVVGSREELWKKTPLRCTKVTAVRHGESEGNVKPRYQGVPPGTDLTARGKEQAKATAKRLKEQGIAKIYCSPLARTMQTAEALAKECGAEVIVDERLRETEFGEYEGKTIDFSDLAIVREKRAKKLETGSVESIYHFPGMESWESVQARIRSFLDEVLPRHRGEHIAIVTHADPVQNMMHFFTKEDPLKISHRPYPEFAEARTFYWDHDTQAQLDLHKETVDEIRWMGPKCEQSTEMTVVRHGETDYNKARKLQGWDVDPPLNDLGHAQAEETAKKLKKNTYDVLLCSPSARAKQTAEHVAKALGMSPVEWDELRERNFEGWTGWTLDELIDRFPWDHGRHHVALHHATPPKGESLSQFLQRAQRVTNRIQREYPGKKVLVVCHGGLVSAMNAVTKHLSLGEAVESSPKNAEPQTLWLHPAMERIPEVLDCWFESGSMPYAQVHYPFEHSSLISLGTEKLAVSDKKREKEQLTTHYPLPANFPADFIAEGIDQTRGWFYTLTVLSAALFEKPAFRHCIVNGTVLAADGKKMSKRLKNYPEPMLIVEKYGADAVRFALMSSPAVRAEDLRFSEPLVEEVLRGVLLPLWNTYSFFVTYANAASFTPQETRTASAHPLDVWMTAEVQDLVNRMTEQLENYDLSATCAELHETIDAMTNWYVRLSRRRFGGKDGTTPEERTAALQTLFDVLLTLSQLLAPFCPFITDAMYLNLVSVDHGSIHLTDWPAVKKLNANERRLITRTRMLRKIVSLGLSLRSSAKVKLRQPLAKATIALSPSLLDGTPLTSEELALVRDELNVKQIDVVADPKALAVPILQIDARKVGPRVGGKVQELIQKGKGGEFTEHADGSFTVLDETLSSDEAAVLYMGKTEGGSVAGDRGIVLGLDATVTEELKLEGAARDVIRAVQQARKDAGLLVDERIVLEVTGAEDVMRAFAALIEEETNSSLGSNDGVQQSMELDDRTVSFRFSKKN